MNTSPNPLLCIHVSPHSDDEAVGCPATLRSIRHTDASVINMVTSLGGPDDQVRRRAEAIIAGTVGDFDVRFLDDVISSDPAGFEVGVTRAIIGAAEEAPVGARILLISPSPHDKHPRHEAVGRATGAAAKALGERAVWWMYSVWGALPLPTSCFLFDDGQLSGALELLDAYTGEIDRNDYRRLVRGRSMQAQTLAAEQVFGFGAVNRFTLPYAELFTECQYQGGIWSAGTARLIDSADPLPTNTQFQRPIGAWLNSPSPSELVHW